MRTERPSQKTDDPHHPSNPVMVMKNTPTKDIHPAMNRLKINLPDGMMVKSTHVCDLEIPGLRCMLEGHIIPDLTIASLIGIQILCKMGCIVVFMDTACYEKYNVKIIF